MNGVLVVNAYYHSEKLHTLHTHLINSAAKQNIDLRLKTNEEMLFEDSAPDFVLFWDKDVMLAKALEQRGLPVFNAAKAIALCDDKAKTYLALNGVVPQPETIIAPLSFYGADYTAFVRKAAARLGYPLVFKERCGSFGEQVYLCQNEADVLSHISDKPFLLQAFIAGSCGEDIRVEVVGNRCVAAMKRTNPDDFRANLTNGGTAVLCTPTKEQEALALAACHALGVSFGGVDILHNGMVCEVNSNAHIINIMHVTGVDIAPFIFEHIRNAL